MVRMIAYHVKQYLNGGFRHLLHGLPYGSQRRIIVMRNVKSVKSSHRIVFGYLHAVFRDGLAGADGDTV